MTPPTPKPLIPHTIAPTSSTPQGVFQQDTKIVSLFRLTENLPLGVKVDPVFSKPLPCIKGESRPSLVGQYQGQDTCDLEAAKGAYQVAVEAYKESCVDYSERLKGDILKKMTSGKPLTQQEKEFLIKSKTPVSKGLTEISYLNPLADRPFSPPIHPLFRYQPTTCGEAEYSIPVVLGNFGLLNPEEIHPFFRLAYQLNVDQLHDFRSAKSFVEVAKKIQPELTPGKQLVISYPASGSHLAPLGIAFHLMDEGGLTSALFNYSEIDENAPKRILGYLKGLAQMPADPNNPGGADGFITRLSHWKVKKQIGYEEVFQFFYKGKAITLRVGIKRSQDHYMADPYLKGTQLLILHDLGEIEEEKYLAATVARYHQQRKNGSASWVVSDGPLHDIQTLGSETTFQGKFGCYGVKPSGEFFEDKIWGISKRDGDEVLAQSARAYFNFLDRNFGGDPYLRSTEFSGRAFSSRSGFHLLIHLDQKTMPVHLVRLND